MGRKRRAASVTTREAQSGRKACNQPTCRLWSLVGSPFPSCRFSASPPPTVRGPAPAAEAILCIKGLAPRTASTVHGPSTTTRPQAKLAKAGERNPDILCEQTLRDIRGARVEAAKGGWAEELKAMVEDLRRDQDAWRDQAKGRLLPTPASSTMLWWRWLRTA